LTTWDAIGVAGWVSALATSLETSFTTKVEKRRRRN
jgi:hypothetical protein